MAQDDRDLLDVLTFELKFLEDGGYGRSPRTPWLRQRAFEDSITCPNFGDPSHPHPCSECLLMQFVPGELKDQDSPCRLIPLNDKGETIDYLFRCGTQLELEEALAGWLRKQISQIEQERKVAAGAKPSGNDPNGMDEIARKRWLALAGNLNYLANRHRRQRRLSRSAFAVRSGSGCGREDRDAGGDRTFPGCSNKRGTGSGCRSFCAPPDESRQQTPAEDNPDHRSGSRADGKTVAA